MIERDNSNSNKVFESIVGLNALRMNNSNGQNHDDDCEGLILRGMEALADLPEAEFRKIVDHLCTNGDE